MRQGQIIIELTVGLSILVVGLLSMFTLVSYSFALNRTVTDDYVATYLAAEGIEIAKNILDANCLQGKAWNAGFEDGSYEADYLTLDFGYNLGFNPARPLSMDTVTTRYGYGGDRPTNFFRRLDIALVDVPPTGTNEVKVNSVVTWESRSGRSQVDLEDHFLNWRAPGSCPPPS